MLDKLNQIDWASVHDAYGDASDIPSLLRTLLNPESTERQRALEELDNRIHHQGTLYEAAVCVAPFLAELIEAPGTPDKGNIAAVFADLAEYKSRDGYSDEEFQWALSLREIVERHIHQLYSYLESGDSAIRCVMARALRPFPEHSAESLPLLQRALAAEQRPEIRTEIANVIDILRLNTVKNKNG
jgi:hypothetical protein